jgi:drug/metabolite transporter (DMT)-like permease
MAFAALGIIWGVPYFFIKLAIQGLSPIAIAWGRIVLATLILLPIAWQRGALRAVMDHKLAIGAFAVVEFVIPFSAISLGERWISSSLAGILIATVPLTIALLSRFFGLHERLGAWRLAGLLLGFAGVVILLGFGTIAGPLGWAGVGCMLLAVLGYAIGPLIVQRHLGSVDPFGPLAASLLVAGIVLLPAALFTFPSQVPHTTGALVARCTGRGVHGPGYAAVVLSHRPRRCSARLRHHLHQPRRGDAAGRVAAARASGCCGNHCPCTDPARLVAGDAARWRWPPRSAVD